MAARRRRCCVILSGSQENASSERRRSTKRTASGWGLAGWGERLADTVHEHDVAGAAGTPRQWNTMWATAGQDCDRDYDKRFPCLGLALCGLTKVDSPISSNLRIFLPKHSLPP